MKYKEIKNTLKEIENSSRFQHTLGVVETAEHLAKLYEYDVNQAKLAALLHDCAKHLSNEEKFAMCKEYHIEITDAEYANPALLHAKCGAVVARLQYGITDEDILHAITVHTTGAVGMNLLDKIIFVSDYIEPGRDKAPRLKKLRKLADEDLDLTMFYIMEDTVNYLQKYDKESMDPTTYEAYVYYKKFIESRSL